MSQLVFKLDLPDLFKILGDDARLEIKNDLLLRFRNEHLKPIVSKDVEKEMAASIVSEVIREYTHEIDGTGFYSKVVRVLKPEMQKLIRDIVDSEFKSMVREVSETLAATHKEELRMMKERLLLDAKSYIEKSLPDSVVNYAKEQAIAIIKARL